MVISEFRLHGVLYVHVNRISESCLYFYINQSVNTEKKQGLRFTKFLSLSLYLFLFLRVRARARARVCVQLEESENSPTVCPQKNHLYTLYIVFCDEGKNEITKKVFRLP